ncbi:MAG: tetratricopeptide repeat protein, partial [Paramuribaculum sp.]|nr:tetratricopeptide repeat protein [Paramuribaculum sp.]
MRRLYILIAIYASVSLITCADIQKGFVRTIMRPGKKVEYLSNARISVKGIPGSFRSKANGQFELELQPLNLKENSPFTLSAVFKEGYELYDYNMSKVYSPGTTMEIIMKNVVQEAEDQKKFARNMFNGAEANYKKKIDELEKKLKRGDITIEKYREQLNKYQDLFDKYQSQIDVIAKRYAGLDYANIDPVTESINVAFSNGDFERADSLLNSLGSVDAKATEIIKAREEIDKKIEFGTSLVEEGIIDREKNLADAEKIAEILYAKHISLLNEFQNDSAAYYLKRRTELIPDNTSYKLVAGTFIMDYLANYNEALNLFHQALFISKEKYGENHSDVAKCYNNIGSVYNDQGKLDEALEYYNKALQIWLGLFGENHPGIATSYNSIGGIYSEQGNLEKALEYYNKALHISLKLFGENHPDVATCYNNIGFVYSSKGNLEKALEYYNKALEIRLGLFGENNPYVATSYNNIGGIYSEQGNLEKALEYYNKALHIS